METVRTIGRFAYEASVIPKGHRKPRLALLSAEAEFAVVCPSADEVVADAASPSGASPGSSAKSGSSPGCCRRAMTSPTS